MTEADRWRSCNHPELVPHQLPELLPSVVSRPQHTIEWRDTATQKPARHQDWPPLHRCTICGQVGEKAVNGT